MKAGRYIKAILSDDATVTALVGTKIYALKIPQSETQNIYPAIAFTCTNTPADRNKTQKATAFLVTATIAMWANTYTQAEDMDQAVFNAFDFEETTAAGVTVTGCEYTRSEIAQDEDSKFFVCVATYEIWLKR